MTKRDCGKIRRLTGSVLGYQVAISNPPRKSCQLEHFALLFPLLEIRYLLMLTSRECKIDGVLYFNVQYPFMIEVRLDTFRPKYVVQ